MKKSKTMKRRYRTLLGTILLFVLLLLCTGTAYADTVAEGTCGENLTWTLDDEGTLTISGEGEMDNYETQKDRPWHSLRANINTVIVSRGVTTIGDYAFYSCKSLTEVTLPDGLTTIGNYTFSHCTSLTKVNFPDGLTTIGDYAFYSCTSLTEVNLPDGLTTVCKCIFFRCTNLTKVNFPDGLTTIGEYAFEDCTSLGVANFPDGLTTIGYNAFFNCTSLTEANFPDGLTTIGGNAFHNCTSLTEVTLPDGLTTSGYGAFERCTNLTKVNLPDGLTTIESYAFYHCESLTEVNFPEGLTTIGEEAFAYCKSLNDVYFPEGSMTIGKEAFRACASLTTLTIPDGWTALGDGAFENCVRLTEVRLPDGLATIGNSAFAACQRLSKVNFPEGLTTIGEKAFFDCGLTEVQLPEGLTTIGMEVFKYCDSLTDVNFPEGLTTIGSGAFGECTSLTEVQLPEGLTTIEREVFRSCTSLSKVNFPEGLTTIGSYAFFNCTSLNALNLPDSLKKIEPYAFLRCISLTEVRLPNGLSSIEGGAFEECTSLTEVSLPNGLTSIGISTFDGCTSLKEVNLPDNLKTIGSDAFRGCASLRTLNLPERLTAIYKEAFRGNNNLNVIQIPKSLKTVAEDAFYGCDAIETVEIKDINSWCAISFRSDMSNPLNASSDAVLQLRGGTGSKVTLPEGITAIPDRTFKGWDMLSSVTLPASLQQIGAGAFAGCGRLSTVNVSDLETWLAIDLETEDSSPLASGTAELKVGNGSSYTSLRKDVTINKGIGKIPAYAFSGSPTLQTVVIPDGVTRIGTGAFASCTGFREVTIPETVEALEEKTFRGCSDLHKILIPETVTRIEYDAFSGCADDLIIYGWEGSEAERYAIDRGITFLPYTEYNEIRTGTITDNIRWTLTGGTTLTIEGKGEVPSFASGESPLAAIADKVKTVKINGEISGLGNYLFEGFTDLQRVDVGLETDLGQIGAHTFSGCSDVEIRCYSKCFDTIRDIVEEEPALSGFTVTKRSGSRAGNVSWMYNEDTGTLLLTSNGSSEFGADSDELPFEELDVRRVEFSENFSCENLPDGLFAGCDTITEIALSRSATTIGANCFSGCTNLKKLTWYEDVESIGVGTFEGCQNLKEIHIGGSGTLDENEHQISEETIEIPETIRQIPNRAFKSCSAVSRIDWYEDPEAAGSAGAIGAEAFCGCSALKEIWVPDHVGAIGDSAFRDCGSLDDLEFAGGLKTLGARVFYGCEKMREMTFEDDLQQIGDQAIGAGRSSDIPPFRVVAPENAFTIKQYCSDNGLNYVTTAGVGGGEAEGQIYVKIAGSTNVKKNQTKKLKFKTNGKVKKVKVSGTGGKVSVTKSGNKIKFKGLQAGKASVKLEFRMKGGKSISKTVHVTVKKSSASFEEAAPQTISPDKKALTFAWYHAGSQKIQVRGVETSLDCNLSKTGIVKVGRTQNGSTATVTVTPVKAGKVTLTMSAPEDDVFAPSNKISVTITVKAQPKTVTAKVKKLSKTKAKVTWKKIAGASSYQVQVAVKKNFKGKKTYNVKAGTLKKTVKITKGKKNYIRVRYKSNGKYSKWSKTLVVKK